MQIWPYVDDNEDVILNTWRKGPTSALKTWSYPICNPPLPSISSVAHDLWWFPPIDDLKQAAKCQNNSEFCGKLRELPKKKHESHGPIYPNYQNKRFKIKPQKIYTSSTIDTPVTHGVLDTPLFFHTDPAWPGLDNPHSPGPQSSVLRPSADLPVARHLANYGTVGAIGWGPSE